ncbi:hypothetical protein DB30_02497 [Enhygromyxa salina]|uniref:N-acetyltransferase domain-containing protein n=1 Tax=Enhygromyxa salina TaxID=215803 RepID=A0A0C1ZK76_9BACT|nr:hypothetical protein [Enhygromyxa salina]KIG17874.1 hypothetical protein DB30_02497 [Enhygromyxa salina]
MPRLPLYSFRELCSRSEHQRFLDGFCAQLERRSQGAFTLNPPVERIAHCTRIVGVFDAHGELVGGYVVNDGPTLVLLSVVPEPQREAWSRDVDLSDVCELNLIWRDGIGHTAFALLVWPRIIADCVTRGRSVILGSGYENKLDRWYRALDPELVYEGPSTTSDNVIFVYAFTRARLVGTYCASFIDNFVAAPWRRRKARQS